MADTAKLALSQVAKGDLRGAWHTVWNSDNLKIEERLCTSYAGDPNSNVTGYFLGQTCYDTVNKIVYTCTAVGDAATTVWENLSPSFYSLAPSGTLLIWDKPESEIPVGWAKVTSVDGKYLIFTSTEANIGVQVGANTVIPTMDPAGGHDHGGVVGDTTLTIAQLPPHSHLIYGPDPGGIAGATVFGGNRGGSPGTTSSTGSGASHNHTISSEADHTHTLVSIDNRPASVTFMLIKKL